MVRMRAWRELHFIAQRKQIFGEIILNNLSDSSMCDAFSAAHAQHAIQHCESRVAEDASADGTEQVARRSTAHSLPVLTCSRVPLANHPT